MLFERFKVQVLQELPIKGLILVANHVEQESVFYQGSHELYVVVGSCLQVKLRVEHCIVASHDGNIVDRHGIANIEINTQLGVNSPPVFDCAEQETKLLYQGMPA